MDFNVEKENMAEFLKRRSSILKTRGDEAKPVQNPTTTLTRRISFHNVLKIQKYDRDQYDMYKEEEEQFHMTSEAFSASILGEPADNTVKDLTLLNGPQACSTPAASTHPPIADDSMDERTANIFNNIGVGKASDETYSITGASNKKKKAVGKFADKNPADMTMNVFKNIAAGKGADDETYEIKGRAAKKVKIAAKSKDVSDVTMSVFSNIKSGKLTEEDDDATYAVTEPEKEAAPVEEDKNSSGITMKVFQNLRGGKETEDETYAIFEAANKRPEDKNVSGVTMNVFKNMHAEGTPQACDETYAAGGGMEKMAIAAAPDEKNTSGVTMNVFQNMNPGSRAVGETYGVTEIAEKASAEPETQPESNRFSEATWNLLEDNKPDDETYTISEAVEKMDVEPERGTCTIPKENSAPSAEPTPENSPLVEMDDPQVAVEESRWSNKFCNSSSSTNMTQTVPKSPDGEEDNGSMFTGITEKMMAQAAVRFDDNSFNFGESLIVPTPTNALLRSRSRRLNNTTTRPAVNASALREPSEEPSMEHSPVPHSLQFQKDAGATIDASALLESPEPSHAAEGGERLDMECSPTVGANASANVMIDKSWTDSPRQSPFFNRVSRSFHQRRRSSLLLRSATDSPSFVVATDDSFRDTVVELDEADIAAARQTLARKQAVYSLMDTIFGRIASLKEEEARLDAKLKESFNNLGISF